MKNILDTLKFILKHPLNKKNPLGALWRWFQWQVKSRLTKNPIAVPFFNNSQLLVNSGMTGATGNIYCGLHDFESMGFLVHLLNRDNTFVDVGANVGSYSILSASLGAQSYSFEPILKAYNSLKDNIKLNSYDSIVTPFNMAVSDNDGIVKMSCDLDTVNRVFENNNDDSLNTVEVESKTLDSLFPNLNPIAIKIDVEGFEDQVIQGGKNFFQKNSLLAAIVEINQQSTHRLMTEIGFSPFSYDPFHRKLSPIKSVVKENLNVLYLRDLSSIEQRINSSPKFKILGQVI